VRYTYNPEWHYRGKITELTRKQVRKGLKRIPHTPAGLDLLTRWLDGYRGDYFHFVDRGEKVKPENRYWLVVGASWVAHGYSLEKSAAAVKRFKQLGDLVEAW